jgi:hypothetical protein
MRNGKIGIALLGALTVGGQAAGQTIVSMFENERSDQWFGPAGLNGFTVIETEGGNPGGYMRTEFNDIGITFANNENSDYLGDYTSAAAITLSIDVLVESINFSGQEVSRPWLVELRDYDTAQNGLPWTSVWFLFDNISQANNSAWTTYSVTFDPNSADLPAGWGGYGAEDPNTFEPTLPAGVTFADVLSGVDEIAFTTLQPGFSFGFADYLVGIDNVTISRVPAPSAAALLGLAGLIGSRRRR